jgi:hypothetical protein
MPNDDAVDVPMPYNKNLEKAAPPTSSKPPNG